MTRARPSRGLGRSLALALALAGCGGDGPTGTAIPPGATLEISLTGLAAPPAGGRYEAWAVDRAGALHSLGPVAGTTLSAANPIPDLAGVALTYEPAGDAAGQPSAHRLLTGTFRGARAELTAAGALTLGSNPLRERPGQFTMFSPSDNFRNGYPSHEESGIWLFNMAPRETEQGDMWVRLTQLQPGWVYEGWMVRDIDTPGAIWLSYGKFTPDQTGAVNSRDDTGWGPFSGVLDFLTAGEEEFPGDDWISNPLGYPWPAELPLPLDLRERDGAGALRWTHVITVEPSSDKGEAIGAERPFVVRPYRDSFGTGGPGAPRTITFRADGVPAGTAVWR